MAIQFYHFKDLKLKFQILAARIVTIKILKRARVEIMTNAELTGFEVCLPTSNVVMTLSGRMIVLGRGRFKLGSGVNRELHLVRCFVR